VVDAVAKNGVEAQHQKQKNNKRKHIYQMPVRETTDTQVGTILDNVAIGVAVVEPEQYERTAQKCQKSTGTK
jgi:hypothetical protein